MKFARAANEFEEQLRSISAQISGLSGSLEVRADLRVTEHFPYCLAFAR